MTVSDLSPDALARLEAKLLADLEVVRKVRALLEEHREALGLVAGGAVAAPGVRTETPAPVVQPVGDSRPMSEILMDVLREMPSAGFHLKAFKRGVYQKTHNIPKDSTVKNFFNQMIRKGSVVIAETNTGRTGNLYRSTLPALVPPIPAGSADESLGHTEETPPVSAV
jgi:hypothetical protein